MLSSVSLCYYFFISYNISRVFFGLIFLKEIYLYFGPIKNIRIYLPKKKKIILYFLSKNNLYYIYDIVDILRNRKR